MVGRHLEESWLKHTLLDMQKQAIKINSNHAELYLWRQRDFLLMDIAYPQRIGTGGITTDGCRRYLNVCTMSDIVNGEGTTRIMDWAYTFRVNHNSSLSSIAYTWGKQKRPSINDKVHWTNFLDSFTRRSKELREPLGQWTSKAYGDQNGDTILIRIDSTITTMINGNFGIIQGVEILGDRNLVRVRWNQGSTN